MAVETINPPKAPSPPAIDVKDVWHAPIVYFDGVANFGGSAAADLRAALDKALLIDAPTDGSIN